jgi:heat shock protein HtpX
MSDWKVSFYFPEFVKSLVKEHNVVMSIYMFLNMLLAIGIFNSLFADTFGMGKIACTVIAIIVYILSLYLVFSPIGEWMMRKQVGAIDMIKSNRHKELSRLEPIFNKVLEKSKQINPKLEEGIKLFVKEDPTVNALAVGRKTVVINTGALEMDDKTIESILAHELGHISQKDTDIRLAVVVGNMFISVAVTVYKLFLDAVAWIGKLFTGGGQEWYFQLMGGAFWAIAKLLKLWFTLVMWVWNFIGKLVVNYSYRKQEFVADEFAVNCGCGDKLAEFLNFLLIDEAYEKESDAIFAAFMSSHPEVEKRIIALADLGVILERPELISK